MDATVTVRGFGREHFGGARLGDRRRTERLVKAADAIACHPGGTLPEKLSGPADLKALYRLVGRPEVTHQAVLATHRGRTLRLMREHPGVVLTVHDTTQLDYTTRRSLRGLGQLAKGKHRGYLCHNTLAVDAGTGTAIGLANQILHRRPRVARGETAKQRRERADRETRLWKAGSEAVGPAPPGRRWVDVCDRGADVFEYLYHKHATGGLYVVRSKHDRNVEAGGEVTKLHAHARSLPDLGTMPVRVSARPAKPGVAARAARQAVVRVAAGPVTLPVPLSRAGDHGDEPLSVWVAHVKELDPPAGEKPLEWVLLTNVETETLVEAKERAGWYALRPVIEEYHKGQKTGCGVELPQIADPRASAAQAARAGRAVRAVGQRSAELRPVQGLPLRAGREQLERRRAVRRIPV